MLLKLASASGVTRDLMRVLRGGSWLNNQDNCRAAYRNRNNPNNRNNNIGFRLCLSSHIVLRPVYAGNRTCKIMSFFIVFSS